MQKCQIRQHKRMRTMKKPTYLSAPWIYPAGLVFALLIVSVGLYTQVLTTKDILTPVVAIFGTFFGATFAFRLTEAKETRTLSNSRREALNRALFTFIRQANAVHQLARSFQEFPSKFEGAFLMPALKPPGYDELVFNISELDFLLDSTNPGILLQLSIEEERFHQMISAIQIRNEFYVEEVQKALSDKQINGKKISVNQLKALLGERLFDGAVNGSDAARKHVMAAEESLPKSHAELLKLAKELYPDNKFISYEKIEIEAAHAEPLVQLDSPEPDYRWKW